MSWSTWIRIAGTSAVAVGVTAVTKSPLAEFLPLVFAVNLFQSQAGEVIGTLSRRADRASESRNSQVARDAQDSTLITQNADHIDAQRTVAAGEHNDSDAERQRQEDARTDRAQPETDTALRSGEDDPARRLQELRQEGLDIIADMTKAAVNDRFQDFDALLDRLGQVRAEHRTLDATPETADRSRENTAPESERADAPNGRPSDEAEQSTDHREGTTSSTAEVSDADARGGAVARTESDNPSSESSGRGESGPETEGDESQRHDVDPTRPARTQQESTVGEGAEQTPTGDQERASEAQPGGPTQPPDAEREHTVGLEQTPTGDHERDSEVPAGDPSGERPPQEAGSTPQPPSPQPASEPSREPQLPARYPGSGVSAEQLQAMKGPWPRFERPESITDATSRKQAALAAMTSDRPARQQPGESTAEQGDQAEKAHHPDPGTGAAPPQPARDREMD